MTHPRLLTEGMIEAEESGYCRPGMAMGMGSFQVKERSEAGRHRLGVEEWGEWAEWDTKTDGRTPGWMQ